MDYIRVMIVKFIGIGILTFSLYGIFFHATIVNLLLMTLVVAGITFIGDLFILPRINQAVAAVGDFALLFLVYWALGNLVVESTVSLLLPALAAAYFGTLLESIYHIYVMDRIHESTSTATFSTDFQTEFAEDSDAHDIIQNSKNDSQKDE